MRNNVRRLRSHPTDQEQKCLHNVWNRLIRCLGVLLLTSNLEEVNNRRTHLPTSWTQLGVELKKQQKLKEKMIVRNERRRQARQKNRSNKQLSQA